MGSLILQRQLGDSGQLVSGLLHGKDRGDVVIIFWGRVLTPHFHAIFGTKHRIEEINAGEGNWSCIELSNQGTKGAATQYGGYLYSVNAPGTSESVECPHGCSSDPLWLRFSISPRSHTHTTGVTARPTLSPTVRPTPEPTGRPTRMPTRQPTTVSTTISCIASMYISLYPSHLIELIKRLQQNTQVPTKMPTNQPTRVPTKEPTQVPTRRPTQQPTTVSIRHPNAPTSYNAQTQRIWSNTSIYTASHEDADKRPHSRAVQRTHYCPNSAAHAHAHFADQDAHPSADRTHTDALGLALGGPLRGCRRWMVAF